MPAVVAKLDSRPLIFDFFLVWRFNRSKIYSCESATKFPLEVVKWLYIQEAEEVRERKNGSEWSDSEIHFLISFQNSKKDKKLE